MPTGSQLSQVLLPAFAGLAVIALPLAALAADETRPPRNEADETKLAKLIKGRTMGEPVVILNDFIPYILEKEPKP